LDPTKPSILDNRAGSKGSREQERIKMTSCENNPSKVIEALSVDSKNETSSKKLEKRLQQDSFDSDTDSSKSSCSNSDNPSNP
jgi:hypothetical protein